MEEERQERGAGSLRRPDRPARRRAARARASRTRSSPPPRRARLRWRCSTSSTSWW
jgi:hypothetical protein